MKKLLFLLLLLTTISYGQVSTGQETPFDYGIKIETGAIQTVTNPVYPATMGTDGTIGRALAKDLPIDISPQPTNYTIPDTKLGSHLKGIDVRLGQIGNTTAGLTNRIYFTAVPTTITAGTFYTSSATGKGAVAGVLQTVSNDDNVKNYFGQDVISIAQPSATTAPPGNYSGQLSVMVDSNSAQERFTVEIYKTDNNGTPIASGITGAPVGNLGVTVVAILDSGVLDLVASAVSNVSVSGNLASTLSLATGERLRYHVSAQKVGTAGNAFMFSLFYGSDYNSYYDVTVTPKASTVVNDSGVTGGTVAEALNTLNTDKVNDSDVLHKTGDETKSGVLTLNNQLRLSNGTSLNPSILFPNEPASDTGINHGSDGEIQFLTNSNINSTVDGFGFKSVAFRITGGLSSEFLKANGSVDSNTYENISNKSDSYTVSSSTTYPNTKALVDGLATKQPLTANIVTGGTGLTNYLTKSIGGSAIGNSLIYDNGSALGIGTTSPLYRFDISGGDSDGVRYTGTSGVEALLGVSSTNVQIGSTSNHAVQFLVNQMTRMTLTNTGLDLLGTPTAPTATTGTNTTQIATTAFAQGVARPYKVYTSLLQLNNPPTVTTMFENNIGAISWTKTGTGIYHGTLSGAFPANKVFAIATTFPAGSPELISVQRLDSDTVILRVTSSMTSVIQDSSSAINLDLRVYN